MTVLNLYNHDDLFVIWYPSGWQQINTGAPGIDAAFCTVGYNDNLDDWGFKGGGAMRFINVTIPTGATIITAYLTLRAYTSDNVNTVNSRFTGAKELNAAIFANLANYQARRGTVAGGANNIFITSSQVNWDALPAWIAQSSYQSPELKTIVQEIVDQTGWASGNSMIIYWDDHDDRSSHTVLARRNRCADWEPTYPVPNQYNPILHIEYTYEDMVYPTEAMARVTGLVHRWSAGPRPVNQLEIILGGLSSQYFSPISQLKTPTPTIPIETAPQEYEPTLVDYEKWYASHTKKEIEALNLTGASFNVWAAWYKWRLKAGLEY